MPSPDTIAAITALVETYVTAMTAGDRAALERIFFERASEVGHYEDELLWNTRDAFIARHQAGVTEIAFPAPPAEIAPPALWDDSQHQEAERRFAAWQSANAALIRRRERKRVPPYVLEP